MNNYIKPSLKLNQELIIIFLLVVVTGLIYFLSNNHYFLATTQRALLNFFYLPVLLGAYFFGKKHATYSAFLSVLMVFSIFYFIPNSFLNKDVTNNTLSRWTDISTWGCFLVLTGYAMGTLYERKEIFFSELSETYQGIVTMLSLLIDSVDKYTQNHSYRVSKYAEQIAKDIGLTTSEIEDIRIAALLHDLGKIGISVEILNKLGPLSDKERKEMSSHTKKASDLLEPVKGRVFKILPLIINHHEKYDGKGYNTLMGESIPVGAKIIAIADVYDALTTDRPYRKALSPLEGKKEIVRGAGTDFDPEIVKHFEHIFPKLNVEEPLIN